MATRTCVECGLTGDTDDFSRRQWRKGEGRARCIGCVTEDDGGDWVAIRDTDCEAQFDDEDLAYPDEEGGFRWVAFGYYTSGEREGERCVAKWLKDESPETVSAYHGDLRCVRRTLDFVRSFNALELAPVPIRVNVPTLHNFDEHSALGAVVYLREPFIEDYEKWNSNSGWYTDESEWAKVMQALSHYSYHASGGHHLLCDLQGGVDDEQAVLSDPAIHSMTMSYGSTDLGEEGIASFFYEHECNEYCSHDWLVPDYVYPYYDVDRTTTSVPWATTVAANRTRTVYRLPRADDSEEEVEEEDEASADESENQMAYESEREEYSESHEVESDSDVGYYDYGQDVSVSDPR